MSTGAESASSPVEPSESHGERLSVAGAGVSEGTGGWCQGPAQFEYVEMPDITPFDEIPLLPELVAGSQAGSGPAGREERELPRMLRDKHHPLIWSEDESGYRGWCGCGAPGHVFDSLISMRYWHMDHAWQVQENTID